MKNNKSILILILLACNLSVKAQDLKPNEIEQLKIQLQKSDDERKAKVKEYVAKFNVPMTGINDRGNYFFIHHIDEHGAPIYYETKGNQEDSILKLTSVVNSASGESVKVVEIKSQSIKKNRSLKFESAVIIKSVTVLTDNGKIQFSNQAIAKTNFELKMAKWLEGNYTIIIKLKNNQTYLSNIKL